MSGLAALLQYRSSVSYLVGRTIVYLCQKRICCCDWILLSRVWETTYYEHGEKEKYGEAASIIVKDQYGIINLAGQFLTFYRGNLIMRTQYFCDKGEGKEELIS